MAEWAHRIVISGHAGGIELICQFKTDRRFTSNVQNLSTFRDRKSQKAFQFPVSVLV